MTSAVDPKPMSRTKAILYAIGSPSNSKLGIMEVFGSAPVGGGKDGG